MRSGAPNGVLRVALAAVVWFGGGCEPQGSPEPASVAPGAVQQPADEGDGWPEPLDALGERLRAEGARHAAGMVPEGGLLAGELPPGRWVDESVVLRAGRCYRIVAVGGEGVKDLDAMLVDPAGDPVGHDGMVGPVAVLGAPESMCLADSGLFRLRLKAFEGQGRYAARLYRRPLK